MPITIITFWFWMISGDVLVLSILIWTFFAPFCFVGKTASAVELGGEHTRTRVSDFLHRDPQKLSKLAASCAVFGRIFNGEILEGPRCEKNQPQELVDFSTQTCGAVDVLSS